MSDKIYTREMLELQFGFRSKREACREVVYVGDKRLVQMAVSSNDVQIGEEVIDDMHGAKGEVIDKGVSGIRVKWDTYPHAQVESLNYFRRISGKLHFSPGGF